MYWYLTAFSLLLLVAAATSTLIALYAWKRRPVPGSVLFAIAMLAVTQWSLAFLLQIVSSDLTNKLAWAKFQTVGMVVLPITWLAFALVYTGRGALLKPRQLLLLAIFPLIFFVLVLTNEAHNLVWQEIYIKTVNDLPILVSTPATWYWINNIFLYGCYLAGSLMIMSSQRYEIASLHPGQALVLAIGLILPWFGLALDFAGLNNINLMPLAFCLSGIIVARYALQFRFIKHSPLEQQALVNNLSAGVLVLDNRLTIVDANAAATVLLQRPSCDLINHPLSAVLPDLSAQYGRLTEHPCDITQTDGAAVRYFEASLAPLYDWRKLPSTTLLTLHDITERKQAEILRDDMTHSIVHDLRSPVSNSLFALQMLKGNLEQDAASIDNRHLVDMTSANTEKVLHLINSILDINRMENGHMQVHYTAVPLDNLVSRLVQSHKAHATEKQITIQHYIPQDLPPAWADAGLLERILQNLIDNSLKFTGAGGVIGITAVAVPNIANGHTSLEVSISDDGPGLSPELAHTAFNKFITGGSQESGNGLGLAFCQMALEAHGERIWANNNPEKGVTFTFSLSVPPTTTRNGHVGKTANLDTSLPYYPAIFTASQPEIAAISR